MAGSVSLLQDIRQCRLCADQLPQPPRPILQASSQARILIAGQAPGLAAHRSGIPFDDASGQRLRRWMGVSDTLFYDPTRIAIVPMGFCYPGKARSGDLPPRPECAETWRTRLLQQLPEIRLSLYIGQYALAWHLGNPPGTLTDTVARWRDYPATLMPLPHPSPRNNIWLKKNPWFESELLLELQARVQLALKP